MKAALLQPERLGQGFHVLGMGCEFFLTGRMGSRRTRLPGDAGSSSRGFGGIRSQGKPGFLAAHQFKIDLRQQPCVDLGTVLFAA